MEIETKNLRRFLRQMDINRNTLHQALAYAESANMEAIDLPNKILSECGWDRMIDASISVENGAHVT